MSSSDGLYHFPEKDKSDKGQRRIKKDYESVSAAEDTDCGWTRMLGLEDPPLSQGASRLLCHYEYPARIPVSLIGFTLLRVVFPSFLFEPKGSESGDEG